MQRSILHAFNDDGEPARHLAAALGVELAIVALHRFPDGEILPRVPAGAETTLVYRSLDAPNEKLVGLLLAADAWRRDPAVRRLVLVAPYMPYLRQDMVFRAGEPVSRDVVCTLLSERFDIIVTVDPHLHRTPDLGAAFPAARWRVLSAQGVVADALRAEASRPDLVVGPDAESRPLVERLARAIGAEAAVFAKTRRSDRAVDLAPPAGLVAKGRSVLILDDVCASGGTLAALARRLREMGAQSVEAVVTHALFDGPAAEAMRAAGLERIRSCDGRRHPSNAFAFAPLLAAALREL